MGSCWLLGKLAAPLLWGVRGSDLVSSADIISGFWTLVGMEAEEMGEAV